MLSYAKSATARPGDRLNGFKKWSDSLSPVHTKDDSYKDNDKDIVLKIVLNVKE